jgi:FAD:protein FMN transferase
MSNRVSGPCRFAHEAMRTQFELTLDMPERSETSLRAVAEEVWSEIDRVERALSPHQDESDLVALNTARGVPCAVGGTTFEFLQVAQALAVGTSGACDPTVGAITRLLRAPEPPTENALLAAQQSVGFESVVTINPDRRTVALQLGAMLDPGALGKGFALDAARQLLTEMGVTRALLHGGTSSVLTLGNWRIAIEAPPGLPIEGFLATVVLNDAMLSVSAAHGRQFAWPDGSTGHVVDPRSGTPAHGTRLCAVALPHAEQRDAHPGTAAEAWSTALMVLGTTGLSELTKQHPDASALVVDDNGTSHFWGSRFGEARQNR